MPELREAIRAKKAEMFAALDEYLSAGNRAEENRIRTADSAHNGGDVLALKAAQNLLDDDERKAAERLDAIGKDLAALHREFYSK